MLGMFINFICVLFNNISILNPPYVYIPPSIIIGIYSDIHAFTATWRCDLGSGHAAVKQQRYDCEFVIGTVYIPMHLPLHGVVT